jgi:hypothetical protein
MPAPTCSPSSGTIVTTFFRILSALMASASPPLVTVAISVWICSGCRETGESRRYAVGSCSETQGKMLLGLCTASDSEFLVLGMMIGFRRLLYSDPLKGISSSCLMQRHVYPVLISPNVATCTWSISANLGVMCLTPFKLQPHHISSASAQNPTTSFLSYPKVPAVFPVVCSLHFRHEIYQTLASVAFITTGTRGTTPPLYTGLIKM